MRSIFQKVSLAVCLFIALIFAACTPEIRQSDEDIDSASIDFYSPDFTFSLKSYLCSKQLLASGSDGSKVYLDGTKCMDLGHFMLYDVANDMASVLYGTDTIWASFNPTNNAFVVDWEIGGNDPSVIEIVEQNVENNYIVVRAKKLGDCEITASINNKSREVTINTHVVDVYSTGMTLQNGEKNENYTIYITSPVESRTYQDVAAVVEQSPGWEKDGDPVHKVIWSCSEEGIVALDTTRFLTTDTCRILPLKAGTTTVTGTSQYRTITVLMTVKDNMVLTAIDSLVIWRGSEDQPSEEYKVETLWLSVGLSDFVNVQVYPESAKKDYPEGYIWKVDDETIATLASTGSKTTDEYSRMVEGKKKGETKLTASMGIDESEGGRGVVSKSIMIKVCNQVSKIDITTSDGSSSSQTVYIGDNLTFKASITDAAAATEFGSLLKWHCDSNYLNISDGGVVTPIAKTPDMGSTKIWATLVHPRYPGREGNSEVVSVKSNEIIIYVKEAAATIEFIPTKFSYVDYTDVMGYDYYGNVEFSDGTRKLSFGDFESMGYLNEEGTIGPLDAVFNDGTGSGNKNVNGSFTITKSGSGYIYTFDFSGDATITGTSGVIIPDVEIGE